MRHRNIVGNDWTRMAIDSLFSRGDLADWQEFGSALARDARLAESALVMAERHEDTGSAALARILVERIHPQVASAHPSVDTLSLTGLNLPPR